MRPGPAQIWGPLVALGLTAVLGGPARATGVAVEGEDWLQVQLPASALAESYRNHGYELVVEDGVATVRVDLAPVESRDRFDLPAAPDGEPDAVTTLARSVVADSPTRFEAVSRLLSWVAREIQYDLDRELDQGSVAVLDRRSGYCTGISRLTVALLDAVGIPAREVAGYLAESEDGSQPASYHRWIEVRYEDRGWVFSDPSTYHHYVPARYVRLASEALLPSPELDSGRVLERRDGRQVVDHEPTTPPGVSSRRNQGRQLAGALRVEVEGGGSGVAVLEGRGGRQVHALIRGNSTFVGIEPGNYTLTVLLDGRPPVERELVFRERVRGAVYVSTAS